MIILNEDTIEARILASKIAKPGEQIMSNNTAREIAVSPSMAKKARNYPSFTNYPFRDLILKNMIIWKN